MANKLIKKVLMCKPLHFAELDYSINPWMKPGTIDETRTMQQWNNLVKTYEAQEINVEVIEQQGGVPDMVFATDQGIVQGKTVLLSRFWTQERRGESKHYEMWFRDHGYTIKMLPDDVYLEGNGDSYLWNDKLFIGVGYRANAKTCQAVSKLIDKEVIPLQIVDPRFYHLDVGFFPLNNDTIFYYPSAFSEESRGVLKKLVPHLVEFTEDEVNNFAANSIVTDHQVVHQKDNPTFTQKLKELGYNSIEVDVSEFMKSGGGIHCLTNVLEEN